jgi:hypothetical protein
MTLAKNQVFRREQLETHIRSTEVLIAEQEARLCTRTSCDREASEMLLQLLQDSLAALLEYQRVFGRTAAASC